MNDTAQDLDYYLAVPYVLAMESVEHPDGEWFRRAEYPELPNCSAEAYSAVEAIEKLEEERIRCIRDLLDRGEAVPVPRPPLRSTGEPLNAERLSFARWLVEEGRLSDSH
jgi:predicted RNase H-like HicB family nuclease